MYFTILFFYIAPELFDWDTEKFKCKAGENVVFESDANGNFFMEMK